MPATIIKDDRPNFGIFIPAGLFIGFALGFVFHNIPAGLFGGLGFGFLVFGIMTAFRK